MPNRGFYGFSTAGETSIIDTSGVDLTAGGSYSASGVYSTSTADKAFDNSTAANANAWMYGTNTNQWIQCQLATPIPITRIAIRNGAPQTANRAVKDGRVEGSFDGITFVKIPVIGVMGGALLRDVDEFTLANSTGTAPPVQTLFLNNVINYGYYRIVCLDNYGDAYMAIAEIEMMTSASIVQTVYGR